MDRTFICGTIFVLMACISYLIFTILKLNKKIEDDTTTVEIETAKLVEIELRSRERLEREFIEVLNEEVER